MALDKNMLLLAALCGLAGVQTGLRAQTGFTTIQDTLFKADGQSGRFPLQRDSDDSVEHL
jgi:hypothetical protein